MNMLSNPALREIQSGRGVSPWRAPPRGEAVATPEPFCVGISAADRILRQTRQVALGQHRSTHTHTHRASCAYLLFHRSSVRLRTPTGGEEIATPLHVSMHAPGEIHAREALNDEGHDCDFIAVAPRLLQRLRMGVAGIYVTNDGLFPSGACETTPEIFLARRRLFSAASRPCTTLNSHQIDAAVERLLALIFDRASARHRFLCGQARTIRGRRIQLVEDAKTILAREYQTDLTAMGLAYRLHCSTAYLSRTFHAATGFRLVDYRHELRLRRAAYLIERADAEIGEIAVRVGFASHSHFSSAFHRRFGMTPSEYVNPSA
ncbi:MAG: helix-turn-helix transcriptional regulator [Proteobacteria bacterium]|uniref:helix-turn-helix transcriptional regulator n=1 Tax=Rudaea sp. TaxID=2136325 RepID=UPI001D81B4B6|nr:helix-turn-helix transcriptional regulator [Pseudomonadota bacterium]MBS0567147.1 helix-turn-helix transcriptional regulator [Pseudomonadota bacterium]